MFASGDAGRAWAPWCAWPGRPLPSVQRSRMRPVRLHRAICFACKSKGHLRRDCPSLREGEPASADGEEGQPWVLHHLEDEAAEFTDSDAAESASASSADSEPASAASSEALVSAGGVGAHSAAPLCHYGKVSACSAASLRPFVNLTDSEGAGLPPSCRHFLALGGRTCGHCPQFRCPPAIIISDPESDSDSSDDCAPPPPPLSPPERPRPPRPGAYRTLHRKVHFRGVYPK